MRVSADIDEFVSNPFIKNCQTKMLIGRYCADAWLLGRSDFEEAMRKQAQLAFVGLTEAYNMSVCLLYHMYVRRCVRVRVWSVALLAGVGVRQGLRGAMAHVVWGGGAGFLLTQ